MKDLLKRIKTNAIISAAAYTVLGVVLLGWPELSTNVLCTALGAVLLICGVVDVLEFIFHRDGSLYSSIHLIVGIILAVVGGWLLLRPTLIAVIIPRIIGVLICFHGFGDFGDAITLRKNKSPRAMAALILGIITILLGAVLVVYPFSAFTTVVRIIGLVLIYDGVSDLWITSQVSYAIKLAEKELPHEIVDVDYEEVPKDEPPASDGADHP